MFPETDGQIQAVHAQATTSPGPKMFQLPLTTKYTQIDQSWLAKEVVADDTNQFMYEHSCLEYMVKVQF